VGGSARCAVGIESASGTHNDERQGNRARRAAAGLCALAGGLVGCRTTYDLIELGEGGGMLRWEPRKEMERRV
jgi:hypothetical protein